MTGAENPDVHSFLFIASTAILILTYALVMTEWVNRAVIALIGAGLTIVIGVLTQDEAIHAIDFNTLGLLAGMMMIVGISKRSGLFGYVAIKAAQLAKASPAGIMVALVLVTAVFSALLDNVTTVLLIVPVTFVICGELKVPVYPFLFTEIIACNIGGTATLIGDPPNILIGSAAHLTFLDFVENLGPVVVVILALQVGVNHLIWGARMKAAPAERARVMTLTAKNYITDWRLLYCSLAVIFATTAGFTLAHVLHLEAATVALLGAAVLLLLDNLSRPHHQQSERVTEAFHEVEWITLFFFVGLFVVIGGVEKAGLLHLASNALISATGGDREIAAYAILWGSAILSAIVDNIPFVATMIPLVHNLAPTFGGEAALLPIWWSLALGACLGGNGSLVGASANLSVAGLAEKNGVPFSFVKFMAMGAPMMLVSVAIAHVYLMWRYF